MISVGLQLEQALRSLKEEADHVRGQLAMNQQAAGAATDELERARAQLEEQEEVMPNCINTYTLHLAHPALQKAVRPDFVVV